MERELNEVTERIIGCTYTVSNRMGCGFLEKVYENAMAHELRKTGLEVEQQRHLVVYYDAVPVGEYIADLIVEDMVLVEIKAAKNLESAHVAQCLNYRRPLAWYFVYWSISATHVSPSRELSTMHNDLRSSVFICG